MKKNNVIIITLLTVLLAYVAYRIRSAMPDPQQVQDTMQPKTADTQAADSSFSPVSSDTKQELHRTSAGNMNPNKTDLRRLVEATDTVSQADLAKLVQTLKSRDASTVANFFQSEIERLRMGNVGERARLIRVADTLQTPELLPFWTDIAYRRSPLFDNEETLMVEKVADDQQAAVQQEMLFAMKNIAILAPTSPEALTTLETIASAASPSKAQDPFSREQAFGLLEELDHEAALRAFNALSSEDPLRATLKERFTKP